MTLGDFFKIVRMVVVVSRCSKNLERQITYDDRTSNKDKEQTDVIILTNSPFYIHLSA